MAIMTVYHGGYQPVPVPEIRIGRNTKDIWHRILLYGYQGAGTEMGKAL